MDKKKLGQLLEMYEHLIKEKTHIEITPYSNSELREKVEAYLGRKVDFTREQMVEFICDEVNKYLPNYTS